MKFAIKGIKLEAQVSGPLFYYHCSIPYLNTTNSWVYNKWLFYREHDIEFDKKCHDLALKHVNDKFLMESFLSQGYSAANLRILN